ncbi:transcription factor MYB8 [Brachypodium distachyon]|uniref:Uncharacterized protein n=1 Tax=Brachypodium distachyon TaxID=15368 RepID=I1ITY5_BRADI|nr:transcription factor MYB8 [Brachypodium distachyon]KQJ92025.1 hypothetical protein BRADI_4g41277v3 [Brachypodium distachyon]|eukprot:XP_003578854.1 transcription factor MYB8 [Brachypodium distachyon]
MGRSPCCEKAHTNKGAWTKEEDQRLIAHIKDHGDGCWRSLPKAAGLQRCGKSCRLRWINYLRPDLKRGHFTEEEDNVIIRLHEAIGNKWSLIAGKLPGRTDNEIKNYWNTHVKRKLIAQGIDPLTHLPLNAANPGPPGAAHRRRAFPAPLAGGGSASCSRSRDAAGSSEDDDSGSLGNLDLDLNLSISPPCVHYPASSSSSPSPPPPARIAAAMDYDPSLGYYASSGVCVCLDRLGFQGNGEPCSFCNGGASSSSSSSMRPVASSSGVFRFA